MRLVKSTLGGANEKRRRKPEDVVGRFPYDNFGRYFFVCFGRVVVNVDLYFGFTGKSEWFKSVSTKQRPGHGGTGKGGSEIE